LENEIEKIIKTFIIHYKEQLKDADQS